MRGDLSHVEAIQPPQAERKDRALESIRANVFSALHDKDPALYQRLSDALDEIKPDLDQDK